MKRILPLLIVSIFICSSFANGEEENQVITLKVLTINVRNMSDFWEERFPLIADEIVRLEPDIIGLQEVMIGLQQTKVLKRLIKERNKATGKNLKYHAYEHLKTGPDMIKGEGIAIYSRYPILTEGFVDLHNGRPALFTRLRVNDSLTVDMYNTHLHHRGGDPVTVPQAKILTEYISSHEHGLITFLTGDMNSRPDSETIAYFLDFGFIDSFMATPEDARTKNPNTSPVIMTKTPLPQSHIQRIDYVFYRPAAEGGPVATPVASEVCFQNHAENGLYPSDHLGVMTTFEVQLADSSEQ